MSNFFNIPDSKTVINLDHVVHVMFSPGGAPAEKEDGILSSRDWAASLTITFDVSETVYDEYEVSTIRPHRMLLTGAVAERVMDELQRMSYVY